LGFIHDLPVGNGRSVIFHALYDLCSEPSVVCILAAGVPGHV